MTPYYNTKFSVYFLLQHLQGHQNMLRQYAIWNFTYWNKTCNFLQISGIMADGAQVQHGSLTL